jgi:capsular exopolysaccharide synthesis family protein
MSRIHEALKKAQQDRALQPPPEQVTLPVTEEAPVLSPLPVTSTALPKSAPVASRQRATSEPLTFELLLQRCATPHWKLDAKKLLHFGSPSHVPGTEEMRTLRSKLYHLAQTQPMKKLLVASALPNEGKTFVASNLAQVMARQHQRRVLLIDSDLRWSRLHMSFGSPVSPGLTEYLRGDADECSIVQKGSIENLFLIAGGAPANNSSELISNGRLKSLLERMAPLFDWIILDSPPTVPVSDARLLAAFCDGVVVVVRAGYTPYNLTLKACQGFEPSQLVGVVLNGVHGSQTSMAYKYYGGESLLKGIVRSAEE